MSLIDTSSPIDNLLEIAGVKQKKDSALTDKLRTNRLETDNILEGLSDIAHNDQNSGFRLQALKMAAQINPETRLAMNDESAKMIPTINIIINDSKAVAINPILIPREITL